VPGLGGTCLQLVRLSRSVPFLVFALVVLLHMVYFTFFPIMLFVFSTSCLLPSQEAVHCHCYSSFLPLQTAILHLRNLLLLTVLPSTVKSRPLQTSLSSQEKHLHFLHNIIGFEMVSMGSYPSCKYLGVHQRKKATICSPGDTS